MINDPNRAVLKRLYLRGIWLFINPSNILVELTIMAIGGLSWWAWGRAGVRFQMDPVVTFFGGGGSAILLAFSHVRASRKNLATPLVAGILGLGAWATGWGFSHAPAVLGTASIGGFIVYVVGDRK